MNGSLKFEGEYLNGELWNGKGKEKYAGEIIYNGEYENGKRKGKDVKSNCFIF